MPSSIESQTFIPVLLGGNLGAYSTARSFYEAYKVTSLVLCTMVTGPIDHSIFIDPVVEPKMMQPEVLINLLKDIDTRYPNKKKILLASSDNSVELIINHKELFPSDWIIPYVDKKIFYHATNKASFYDICEKEGVPYPKSLVISEYKEQLPFDFPIIIKPTNSMKYHSIDFPGKEKVYICETPAAYKKIIQDMKDNGYADEIILQEYIPGDDSLVGVATVYSSHDTGEVKVVAFGQTLLEDHTPSAIGNHLAILTRKEDQIVRDVTKLVKATGWTGFSNYDVKYDSRNQTYKFFELNARLGRSNYYVTAAGKNVAVYYVKDFIEHEFIDYSVADNQILYSAVPKKLLLDNIHSRETKNIVQQLYKAKEVFHPLASQDEPSIKRKLYVKIATLNYFKKFKTYPQPH
ncbi:carboxylate--amine ligase [Carnobacterium pleistocenium]|uniref:carboxylate--amine ligase n=1 Tax=Carnobacterium pleistocenium TaxID=181073 RepID=UPI000558CF74|nr:carbamoyl phosphate synthase-like protein [Carnobacterium pleistocenium]